MTQKMYDSIVERMLKRPGAAMIVYGIITAVAVILFMRWPTTFIPEEDDGYFLVVSQLPPGGELEPDGGGHQADRRDPKDIPRGEIIHQR